MDWQRIMAAWLPHKDEIEMIVPVLALIISGLSILLTFLSVWAQGRQSRMSVMPMPYVRLSDYLNLVAVELVNGGVGTFVIDTIIVTEDARRAQRLCATFRRSLWKSTRAAATRLKAGEFGALIDSVRHCNVSTWDEFLSMAERRPVPPNESVPLLMLSGLFDNEDFKRQRDDVRWALSTKHIVVTGHDIHGNCFATTRSLDWFGVTEKERALSSRGPEGM